MDKRENSPKYAWPHPIPCLHLNVGVEVSQDYWINNGERGEGDKVHSDKDVKYK